MTQCEWFLFVLAFSSPSRGGLGWGSLPPTVSISISVRECLPACAWYAFCNAGLVQAHLTVYPRRCTRPWAGMHDIFATGHSSSAEAWKARPGLHYACEPPGKGCKRMLEVRPELRLPGCSRQRACCVRLLSSFARQHGHDRACMHADVDVRKRLTRRRNCPV